MNEIKNKPNEQKTAYVSLMIYTVVGIFLRYFITFPCGPAFHSMHVAVGYDAIPFIVIGLGLGLFSFIFPTNKNIATRIGRGVITGIGLGFGGTSALILALNPCG